MELITVPVNELAAGGTAVVPGAPPSLRVWILLVEYAVSPTLGFLGR